MGIDIANAIRLIELGKTVEFKGTLLTLGRQGFHVRPRHAPLLQQHLEAAGYPSDIEPLIGRRKFAEPFFEMLGFENCLSMDMSEYEGCDITHDLNAPTPEHLMDRFDFILDGGTIEHVFNAPMAFRNVFNILRVGGLFYSVNGGNGFFGHGFYQFSPELPWSFWHRSCGFDIVDCVALPENPKQAPIVLPDPESTGRRVEPKLPQGPVYLCYTARKTAQSQWGLTAQQSDYVSAWSAD